MSDVDRELLVYDWKAVFDEARSTSLAVPMDGSAVPRGSLAGAMDKRTSSAGRFIDRAVKAGVLEEAGEDAEISTGFQLSDEYEAWRRDHSTESDRREAVDDLMARLGLEDSRSNNDTDDSADSAPEAPSDERSVAAEAAAVTQPDTTEDQTQVGADIAVDDLLANDGEQAKLPDEDELLDAVEAAIDYFHSELTAEQASLITEKWGISRDTIDDLKIGFVPGDDDLVEHLFEEGFMPLTIINAGLETPGIIQHVYATGSKCPDDCWHDVPDAFDEVARRRAAGDLEYEDIDLAAVVAHAQRLGILGLDESTTTWWDNRIVFPYWHDGRGRYLIARATGRTEDQMYDNGEVAKYLKQTVDKPWVNDSAISEPIYGLDSVSNGDPLIITEGMTDAIMAHQAGFSCIAPVTKQFKSEHRRPLLLQAQRASEVYLCLDNEESGEGLKGAVKTAQYLAENDVDARIASLPRPDGVSKVDLADYLHDHSREDLEAVLEAAHHPEDVVVSLATDAEAEDDTNVDAIVWAGDSPAEVVETSGDQAMVSAGGSEGAIRLALADGGPEEPPVSVLYQAANSAKLPLELSAVGETSDYLEATPVADVDGVSPPDIRVLVVSESSGDAYSPSSSQTESHSGDGSALFNLDIRDVTGMDHLDRGKNPIKHRGDSENYFVIIQEGGDYLAYDHKAPAGYYALTYILAEAPESDRTVEDPTGRLDDEDIFVAWAHAKRRGYIPESDPAPYRALLHIVRQHDLLPSDMVPSADNYGDGERLPESVYNRALDVIETEYGVSSGRSPTGSGERMPTEEDLGLNEEAESEDEELRQFVSQIKLNQKRAESN